MAIRQSQLNISEQSAFVRVDSNRPKLTTFERLIQGKLNKAYAAWTEERIHAITMGIDVTEANDAISATMTAIANLFHDHLGEYTSGYQATRLEAMSEEAYRIMSIPTSVPAGSVEDLLRYKRFIRRKTEWLLDLHAEACSLLSAEN